MSESFEVGEEHQVDGKDGGEGRKGEMRRREEKERRGNETRKEERDGVASGGERKEEKEGGRVDKRRGETRKKKSDEDTQPDSPELHTNKQLPPPRSASKPQPASTVTSRAKWSKRLASPRLA